MAIRGKETRDTPLSMQYTQLTSLTESIRDSQYTQSLDGLLQKEQDQLALVVSSPPPQLSLIFGRGMHRGMPPEEFSRLIPDSRLSLRGPGVNEAYIR